MISSITHNFYSDFLRSFKKFIGKVTNETITKYEFNYGSKTVDFDRMMKDESFEYPTCIIELNDTVLIDNVSPIARNANMNVNPSMHNFIIAENLNRNQGILLDKRWINLQLNIILNLEDASSLINYYDLFISQLPYNFSFYDYKYISYIDITPFAKDWDITSENVFNVFVMPDPTNDRNNYYAMVENQPIIEMNSVTKNQDKESGMHQLNINFDVMIELPNLLRGKNFQEIRGISIVIDSSGRETPILIDVPDNLLSNKNVDRGIVLDKSCFHLGQDGEDGYLEIQTDVDLSAFKLSLWAVEDTTSNSSKRFFIPINENTKIDKDNNTNTSNYKIYLSEIDWFLDFNFDNKFGFYNLILFKKG